MEQATKISLAKFGGRLGGGTMVTLGIMMLLTTDSIKPHMKKSGIILAGFSIIAGIILYKYSTNWLINNDPASKLNAS